MSYTEESDDQSSVKSDDSGCSDRVKFLCSYGGRIVPRSKDGKLRYVGGVTRVVAAKRAVKFEDLLSKMQKIIGSAVTLKCQMPTEDLDALVSIKSDEDLLNILEEYDKLGAKKGFSKVRAFLFHHPPSSSQSSLPPSFSGLRVSYGSHNSSGDSSSSDSCKRAAVDSSPGKYSQETPEKALKLSPSNHYLPAKQQTEYRSARFVRHGPHSYAMSTQIRLHQQAEQNARQTVAKPLVHPFVMQNRSAKQQQFMCVDHSASSRMIYAESAQAQQPSSGVGYSEDGYVYHSPPYHISSLPERFIAQY
eukprot:TRINITY_DN1438_c0_g1_i1.p1 TRINITY_DN1438_c0_g1~~TRINITY_DN1438_c0_g1_i1.p1  ORF type:complete len:305 (-),score=18.87 TRINITY_DN1438_c0_g1_i1:1933-2847(-)